MIYPMKPLDGRVYLPSTPAGWWCERKYDGWGVVLIGNAIYTRRGTPLDWPALDRFRCDWPVPLHGELCAKGMPGCHNVQRIRSGANPILYVFDLMIPTTPLEERRRMLEEELIYQDGHLRLAEGFWPSSWEEVNAFLRESLTMGCDGVVLKAAGSPYILSGEVGVVFEGWIKVKGEVQ